MFSNDSTGILNIAHRGARAYAPENTLEAFAKAKCWGCEMFELDVRLSKDGVVMVYHDDHLLRCTDAKKKFPNRLNYPFHEFTLSQLKSLDAGSWYLEQLSLPAERREGYLQSLSDDERIRFVSRNELDQYASGRITIPTLAEALALAADLGLMVNVELKSGGETDTVLVESAVKEIRRRSMTDRVLISSFNHDLLTMTRKQAEPIRTAALVDLPLKNPLTTLKKLKADAYNMNCYHGFALDRYQSKAAKRYLDHIVKIRSAGFAVNIWTCNDVEQMHGLLAAGVSGLISDYPNRVKAAISTFVKSKDSSENLF